VFFGRGFDSPRLHQKKKAPLGAFSFGEGGIEPGMGANPQRGERQRNAPVERFDIPPTERSEGEQAATKLSTTEGHFHSPSPLSGSTKRKKRH